MFSFELLHVSVYAPGNLIEAPMHHGRVAPMEVFVDVVLDLHKLFHLKWTADNDFWAKFFWENSFDDLLFFLGKGDHAIHAAAFVTWTFWNDERRSKILTLPYQLCCQYLV